MSFKNPNIYRNTHSPIPFRLKKVKRTREREKEKRSIFTENSLQRYRFISPIVRFPWRHGSQRGDTRSNRTQTTPFPPSLSLYIHTHTSLPSSSVEIVTNAGNVAAGRIESPRNPGRRPGRCCKRCSS